MASLNRSEVHAEIYKPNILITRDEDFEAVARDILSLNPASIGFSTWCDSFPHSLSIAEAVKAINPSIPVIFGGPQASIMADETMNKFPFVDFILQGEADHSLPLLVSRIFAGQHEGLDDINGLAYRIPVSGEIIINHQADLIEEMDELPIPAYENIIQKSKLRIDAGRGCPYKCTYCSTNEFFSRKYRVKTADRLLAEMKYCKDKLGISSMGISHDMFTLNKKFVEEFSKKLTGLNHTIDAPYNWTCSARTDCVSGELLNQMRESGCKAIFFGIETGSVPMQKRIRKNLDLDEALRMVRHSTELGIVTIVSYMAGFPGETLQDMDDTLRSILRMLTSGARPQLTLLSVLPGTSIYNEYVNDLEYDGVHSGFSVSHLTEKIRAMILKEKEMFSSFYYLPNKHISRDTYLFLADLVNNLEHFIPTMLLLRDHLQKDFSETDLLSHIERIMPEYKDQADVALPELFFLTDVLRKYLEWLYYKGLPSYCWDVFQADFTKAFMIAEYERWQLANAVSKRPRRNVNSLEMDNRIRVRPYWKVIETEYYLYDFLQNPAQLLSKSRFRKGTYHYLVLPVSHRMARILKVPTRHIPVYSIKDSTVKEFIEKNVVHLDKAKLLKMLKGMARLGLVDIEPSLQAAELT